MRPRRPEAPGPPRAGLTDPVAWLIALAVFAAYLIISLFRYLRLDPGSWDLGIFTEYIRQFSLLRAPVVDIKGAGFNLLGDHFTPILALVAPFFRLFPTPVTLLVVQALLTAVSVVPVCAAARELLGTAPARMIGLAYGFSWGLQQMINFDFHAVAFATALLAFSLSALVRRRPVAAAVWALPLVFVKENQGFTVAALGLVMLGAAVRARTRGRRPGTWAWAGAVLVVWGLGWSALAILVIIPHFNPAHHYAYWKDGGAVHPGSYFAVAGLLHQLASGGPEKVRTTMLILAPVVFLALRSPVALIAVPGLLLRFASIQHVFWGTEFHYNATLMPVIFLAAVDALARISASAARRAGQAEQAHAPPPARPRQASRPVRRPGGVVALGSAALMVVIAAILSFHFPLASLWHPATYRISAQVRAEQRAMARVPDGVTVEATLTMLAPMAARDTTYWIGTNGNPAPRYIVFDETDNAWYPRPTHVLAFVEQRHPGTAYRQVFEADHVYVFRRAGTASHGGTVSGG